MKFELGRVEISKRKRLPHWKAEHAVYFLTFNLFDAVPASIRTMIHEQAAAQYSHIRTLRGEVTIAERMAIEEWVNAKIGETLDASHGACFLRSPAIATIVANAIQHFDQIRYQLLSWCVMPNHVHVVMFPFRPVDEIVHSLKSFTSKKCNMLLARTGKFWQDDYYDRCIRDSAHLSGVIEYVAKNPTVARLGNWPFVQILGDRLAKLCE